VSAKDTLLKEFAVASEFEQAQFIRLVRALLLAKQTAEKEIATRVA